MAGSETIGVQELLVQVVQLTDNLTAATARVKALETAVAAGGGTTHGSPYIKGGRDIRPNTESPREVDQSRRLQSSSSSSSSSSSRSSLVVVEAIVKITVVVTIIF